MRGRTALITGGARGIGAAIAKVFAREGARVLTPTRAELDVASETSTEAYLRRLDGSVDLLVNNAGVNPLAALEEVDSELLRGVLEVNLVGPMRLARGVAAGMRDRGYGRILNISSVWGSAAKPRRMAYCASKAGLEGLTRALAVELGPHGVLVSALAPGFVDTDLTRQNNSPQEIAALAAGVPLRRLADPSEIAELAAFLCSSRNSYVTGQVVVADGGFLCT